MKNNNFKKNAILFLSLIIIILLLIFSIRSENKTIIVNENEENNDLNIDNNAKVQQYPGTAKVDYSRLRESGVRTSFSEFTFKVTGDSVINVKALEPFLTSLIISDTFQSPFSIQVQAIRISGMNR